MFYLCILLWCLFIVLRLHYGKFVINRLSFRPFIWATLYCVDMLPYFLVYAAISSSWTPDEFQSFFTNPMSSEIFRYFFVPLLLAGNFCSVLFTLNIFYEQYTLLAFIIY